MRIFGGYFLGQLVTFGYLVETMGRATQFGAGNWPQFSVYNLVIANFWPLYWAAHFVDPAKVDAAYWHVYDVAQARVTDVVQLAQLISN